MDNATNMKTIEMPQVGDHIKWRARGGAVIATVLSFHTATFSNPGGVRIVDDIGIKYSFHPQAWMSHVISGKISKLK